MIFEYVLAIIAIVMMILLIREDEKENDQI